MGVFFIIYYCLPLKPVILLHVFDNNLFMDLLLYIQNNVLIKNKLIKQPNNKYT